MQALDNGAHGTQIYLAAINPDIIVGVYGNQYGRLLLHNRRSSGGMDNVDEFRSVMDAMQPVVLTNSAWETAVATGVLGRMDFELVSALTLTYNSQQRFDENYRNALRTLMSPNNLNSQNLKFTMVNAAQFVADVTSNEAELSVYYDQTLDMLSQQNEISD